MSKYLLNVETRPQCRALLDVGVVLNGHNSSGCVGGTPNHNASLHLVYLLPRNENENREKIKEGA